MCHTAPRYDEPGMEETALIRQAKKGDLEAFNQLVLAHQARVYNVAYRIMGERDAAEDATQEAFISAYRKLRSFRGGSFRAWLMRIVTNACYDELRRRKRRPAGSLDALVQVGEDSAGDLQVMAEAAQDPEAAAEQAELARAIQDCMNHLAPEFRIVAVLADVQGYDYKEVAQAIGKPVGTVKSRLARARARLRECLQRHGELLPAAFRLESETIP